MGLSTSQKEKPHIDSNSNNNPGKQRDLRERTKQYALRIIKLYLTLPNRGLNSSSRDANVEGRYICVGAHYREAQRAKSDADFISKIEGALQELDESTFWLELLAESFCQAS